MLQTNVLPFNAIDGVKFNVLIESHIVLNNGNETVMFTAVPTTLDHDDALFGIVKGLQISERVISVRHEIFSLINGKIEPLSYTDVRYLK